MYLLQCSYLVHTAAKQAVSTKQFVSTLCWLQASRKQADGDALICKLCKVHCSVSIPERDRKLFAICLELRTNVGASVPICLFHLRSQHSFPYFFLFISCISFPSSVGRWAMYEYMCSPENNLILCLYSSQLFIETIAAMHHWACTTLDPSTVARRDANAVPRAVSRVKHHQEEAEAYIRSSCPGSERFRRGWEYFEDRKGLNIVFHTWNLTSSVRDLVTPDIWRWPTDTHMFVCGTPSRLAGPNRKLRGVPSSLVSQISN